MDIADQRTHLCLTYVAAVQRQGYVVSVSEFRAYANRPQRQATPLFGAATQAANLPLRPRTESMLDYLFRLGWVDLLGPSEQIEDDDGVVVNNLGRAVLGALDEGSLEEELPATIVLDQGDPVARARVGSEVAALGALVDRFFSADDLLAILHRTEVTRVLTGPEPKHRLAGLIPVDGQIRQLGTSFGGVSKRLSVMITMAEDAAAAGIRTVFEEAWAKGERVEANVTEPRADAPTKGAAKSDAAAEEAPADGAPADGGELLSGTRTIASRARSPAPPCPNARSRHQAAPTPRPRHRGRGAHPGRTELRSTWTGEG